MLPPVCRYYWVIQYVHMNIVYLRDQRSIPSGRVGSKENSVVWRLGGTVMMAQDRSSLAVQCNYLYSACIPSLCLISIVYIYGLPFKARWSVPTTLHVSLYFLVGNDKTIEDAGSRLIITKAIYFIQFVHLPIFNQIMV